MRVAYYRYEEPALIPRYSDLEAPNPAKMKRVAFALPTTKPFGGTTPGPMSLEAAIHPSPVSEGIVSLCASINKVTTEISCLGVLVDDFKRQHRISVTNTSFPADSVQTVSLKTLLAQPTKLRKKDRLVLGVKLASTLLQLHKTPWLEEMWGNQDILFLKQQEDSRDAILQKPFVSKPFTPPTCTLPPQQLTGSTSKTSPEVRNQSIFALGIVLIELWFGKPLEDLRIPADMGEQKELSQTTDFATARRLSEEVYEEAGDWYGHAVRRCIYCEFDQRHNSLDNDRLKEAVHWGVVSPLEENLSSFCGGELDELLA